jgi:hypothetical protein
MVTRSGGCHCGRVRIGGISTAIGLGCSIRLDRSPYCGKAMASSRTQTSPSSIERSDASRWRMLRAMLIVVAGLALVTGPAGAQSNDEAGEASVDASVLEGVLAALQSDHDELKARFDQLTASHRDLDSRYAALEKAQEELQAKYAQLSSSNGDLGNNYAALEKAQEELRAKYVQLSSSNVALGSNYAALEQAYTQVSNDNAQLRLLMHARAVTVRTAAKAMVDRTVTSAGRNLSSVSGQAIPYVGVALILGLTAWEIHDACETLRDVNQMSVAIGDPPFDPSTVCGKQVPTSADVLNQVTNNWSAAYQSAAGAINAAGPRVPAIPPRPLWVDVKGLVCPVIGRVPRVC